MVYPWKDLLELAFNDIKCGKETDFYDRINLSHIPNEFKTVHLRHPDVHDQKLVNPRRVVSQRIGGTGKGVNLEPSMLKPQSYRGCNVGLVIYD